MSRQTRMILNPSMRSVRRLLAGTLNITKLVPNITSLVPNITSCSKYRLIRFACGDLAPLTGMSRPLCSNRSRCWNCHRLAKVPSLRTFSFRLLGVKADRLNRSDEPLDTGIYARLPKPNPLSFPLTAVRQARVKRIPNASQTHIKRILNSTQTHPISASAIAQTAIPANRPDRRREVMRLYRSVNVM